MGFSTGLAVAASLMFATGVWGQRAHRVLSLDQCADQFVLALSPRESIVGLSERARDADAYLAGQSKGLPLRRATTESVLAARPDIIVRFWGGEERLLSSLRRRGIQVVTLNDAPDFAGVAENIRLVAAALDQPRRGQFLITHMQNQLDAASDAWRGRAALYLTSGGDTAGSGTLINAMMRSAGLRNLATGFGYRSVSLEYLIQDPPQIIVEGFFDPTIEATQRWSLGRHAAVRRLETGRGVVRLPARLLGCPAWFAADAVTLLAAAAPRGGRQ